MASVTCDVWEKMGREETVTLQLCPPFVSSGHILLVFLCLPVALALRPRAVEYATVPRLRGQMGGGAGDIKKRG